jgi:hypothetical protein
MLHEDIPAMNYPMDKATFQRLAQVYPDLCVRWIRLANDFYSLHGLALKVATGLRTYADQHIIYAKGRVQVGDKWMPEHPTDIDPATGKPYPHTGIVSWAKPGDSWHHFSAVDSCFDGPDPYLEKHPKAEFMWSEHARLAEAHGLEAGYRWAKPKQDKPHVQIRYGGMTLAQVKDLYAHGGLKAVWAKYDQIRGVEVGSEWSGILHDARAQLVCTADKLPLQL